MSAEVGKVQRLAIRTAQGGGALVNCARQAVDVDVSYCQSCEHCIGLSARDAYLVCSWHGRDATNAKGHGGPMKPADPPHTEQDSLSHATSAVAPPPPAIVAAIAPALGRFERPIVTATLDDTVFAVACRMRNERVGCIVVVRDGRPVGILTDRDIVLRVVAEGLDPHAVLVSSIVTYDAITIQRTDGFETAVRTMREHGVRRMPLVDENGRVTGIVTADDLVALLSGELAALGTAIASNVDGSETR